jgi:hypothetical protein
VTSGLSDTRAAAAAPAGTARERPSDPTVQTAVVLATAPAAAGGGPAALLPFEEGTLLSRVVGQLVRAGVRSVLVLTRPHWEGDVRQAAGGAAEVRSSPSVSADLRAIADLADGTGALVIAYGEVVTHGEALRGLIAEPRATSQILTGARRRSLAVRVEVKRARIVSSGSPYHAVRRPSASFLGVLRVAPADQPLLARSARELAALLEAKPEGWEAELGRKARRWRQALAEPAEEPADDHALPDDHLDEAVEEEPDGAEVPLSPDGEARLAARVAAAREDAAALALLGLVRGGAVVGVVFLRRFYWSRPLSAATAASSEERIRARDEDRLLLASAVKSGDGFFTTFFVSPYSKHIARWAARRGFTPNQVTAVSMLIGIAAAAAFASGERAGLIAGAVLLQAAFTTDCVDGQLARYTRTFSRFGAWLDSIFDRAKEYVAFAGLAIGASVMGDPVWLLACCAITLQTIRHMADFSYGGTQLQTITTARQPPLEQSLDAAGVAAAARRAAGAAAPPPARRSFAATVLARWQRLDRLPAMRWIKRMISFPIGERFALISLTAALFTPRATFVAVLVWGGIGFAYTQTGRILRAIR